MKTLDKYIVKNFLLSALLCLVALMSLRIVADLFFNMDEFTKARKDDQRTLKVVAQEVGTYYGYQSLPYFRELGGVIVVTAAAFTLARMNHTNELTAVLASGVSLHRVLLPVLVCAIGLNLLIVLDTEVLIPRVKHRLIRSRDDVSGTDSVRVRTITDGKKSSWYASKFFPAEWRLANPLIILREQSYANIGHLTGPEAIYDASAGGWVFAPAQAPRQPGIAPQASMHVPGWKRDPTTDFVPTLVGGGQIVDEARRRPEGQGINSAYAKLIITTPPPVTDRALGLKVEGRQLELAQVDGEVVSTVLHDARFTYSGDGKELACFTAERATYRPAGPTPGWELHGGRLTYVSNLDPGELTLRQSRGFLNYLSTGELTRLLRTEQLSEPQEALLARHSRFAEFFNNIILLLVAGPFILSRERNIKSSAALTVLMVGGVYLFIQLARHIELQPALAAWLPILVFGPVAVATVDAIKT